MLSMKRYTCLCDFVGLDQTSCQQTPGRTYAAGRCFQLYWWTGLTWFAARADCINRGGDLLRLDTAELVTALTSNTAYMTGSRWWIDGINELWTWTNGTHDIFIVLAISVFSQRRQLRLSNGYFSRYFYYCTYIMMYCATS